MFKSFWRILFRSVVSRDPVSAVHLKLIDMVIAACFCFQRYGRACFLRLIAAFYLYPAARGIVALLLQKLAVFADDIRHRVYLFLKLYLYLGVIANARKFCRVLALALSVRYLAAADLERLYSVCIIGIHVHAHPACSVHRNGIVSNIVLLYRLIFALIVLQVKSYSAACAVYRAL